MRPFKLANLNAWPVLQRELRAVAHRRANYWLRFASASAGMLVLWNFSGNADDYPEAELGRGLLTGLHTVFIGLILLIVPGLMADCIAREKREGTLGLLFLTPLSAGGIVAGKTLAQVIRALTLWLAVLPILAIPFLLGGVNWFVSAAV